MKCLIIAYMLVCGSPRYEVSDNLEARVAKKIQKGWQPIGGLGGGRMGEDCQAMVKYKCPEGEL